jgi:epoxyqueuosine reductase
MITIEILQTLTQFAREKNCLIGITDPAPIHGLKERLEQTETPYTSKSLELRLLPSRHLPNVKSIIVVALPYTPLNEVVFSILAAPDEQYTGLISSMALNSDYHESLRELLNELANLISSTEHKILVDGGGLVEREWAVKAGIGFWGKNCCVISPTMGSFFNICLLLTDLNLPLNAFGNESGHPNMGRSNDKENCGNCTKCIDACPGNALTPFSLNHKKCVSYISSKKGPLTDEEQKIMGRWVYGCDICQRVCPFNEAALPECPNLSLHSLIMNEENFNQIFGQTTLAWRGSKILKRNVAAVFKTTYKREQLEVDGDN